MKGGDLQRLARILREVAASADASADGPGSVAGGVRALYPQLPPDRVASIVRGLEELAEGLLGD